MNINVGSYTTTNFSRCPEAKDAFEDSLSELGYDGMDSLEEAAENVDQALGILVMAETLQNHSMTGSQFNEFMSKLEDAEDILDSVGELDKHFYLRDMLEPQAIEMYDMNDIDPDDEAAEYDDEESMMFDDHNY